MNKFIYLLSLPVIVSLSCSLVTGLLSEAGLVEATGPILGMTVSASLDDQGQPVDSSFTYPADQPEMVVLVRIGEVDPGALTFSWYRVIDAEDELLFEQTVAVEARDAAFSTGLNPGILAAGTYKVVATFAGGSETIAWDVVEAQPDDLTDPVSTSASAAGGAPAPGDSGKTPAVVPQPGTGDDYGPNASIVIFSYDRAHQVEFGVLSGWGPKTGGLSIGNPPQFSFTVQVSAAITGLAPGASREYRHPAGTFILGPDYVLNPCSLPGGSDLPGTSITVSAVPLGFEARRDTDTKILGADTSLPEVTLVSAPSNGVKVEGGQKIELSGIAVEKETGGSWQTGVSKILIDVMQPSFEEVADVPSGKSMAACTEKSWKQTTEKYFYTVPEDVKGDLRICAFGYDFAGNIGKDCVTFPTGDVWEGTLQTDVTMVAPGGTCTSNWRANIKIFVNEDGTASATFSVVEAPMNSCGGSNYAIVGSQGSISGVVVNGAGFTIPLSQLLGGQAQVSAFIQKTGSNQASGTATPSYSAGSGITNSFVMKFELTCKTCKP